MEEVIKFKDLIILLMDFVGSIKDLIEEKKFRGLIQIIFAKTRRLGTQLKLWKAKLVQSGVQLR